MKTRIVAPFVASVAAFTLSYFFIRLDEGFVTLLLLAVGVALAVVGAYVTIEYRR